MYSVTYRQCRCTLLSWACRGFLRLQWRIYHNLRRLTPVRLSCQSSARNGLEQQSSGCCPGLQRNNTHAVVLCYRYCSVCRIYRLHRDNPYIDSHTCCRQADFIFQLLSPAPFNNQRKMWLNNADTDWNAYSHSRGTFSWSADWQINLVNYHIWYFICIIN